MPTDVIIHIVIVAVSLLGIEAAVQYNKYMFRKQLARLTGEK